MSMMLYANQRLLDICQAVHVRVTDRIEKNMHSVTYRLHMGVCL